MPVVEGSRQKLGHGMLLILDIYAVSGAAVEEITVFGRLFRRLAAIYTQCIDIGAVGHCYPVDAGGILYVVP